jgi:hypothetical protein
MSGQRELITARLKKLRAEVMAGMIKHAPAWDSDDVIIGRTRPLEADPFGFRPTNRFVITEHRWELSWLFARIAEDFGPVVDIRSKYVFFGSLADAANRHLRADAKPEPDCKGLLLAVLNEADGLATEIHD